MGCGDHPTSVAAGASLAGRITVAGCGWEAASPIPVLRVQTLLAALAVAAPAQADTLGLTPSPAHSTYGQTVRVAYTGTIAGPPALYATVFSYVQRGRTACARTQVLEGNRPASEQLHMLLVSTPGAFSVRRPMENFAPGLYRLCAYLQHTAAPDDPPDALATALVRIAKPRR